MKGFLVKNLAVLALILVPMVIFAQESAPEAPQKHALVIGNSAYTGLTPLSNPVNDASDIAAVLEYLGFDVEKVLNGTLEQMEDAVMRLGERLRASDEHAYGFFFYAGHGCSQAGRTF